MAPSPRVSTFAASFCFHERIYSLGAEGVRARLLPERGEEPPRQPVGAGDPLATSKPPSGPGDERQLITRWPRGSSTVTVQDQKVGLPHSGQEVVCLNVDPRTGTVGERGWKTMGDCGYSRRETLKT